MKTKELEKIRTNLLNFCISKDETRPFLTGICHYSPLRALVSNNGHIGCILKSRYSEKLADKIIDAKTYELIDREYPNVTTVIPNHSKLKKAEFIIDKIHYVKQVKDEKPTYIYFHDDQKGNTSVNFEKKKNFVFAVNAYYLKYMSGNTWHVAYQNKNLPLLIALSDDYFDGDTFLMMPIKVNN